MPRPSWSRGPMSENKRQGLMHPNPYFVDEKTEAGLLTTSHQSLSEMSHHLPTYSKMMPWSLQVLRSRMCLREAKEKKKREKTPSLMNLLPHDLKLTPSEGVWPCFSLLENALHPLAIGLYVLCSVSSSLPSSLPPCPAIFLHHYDHSLQFSVTCLLDNELPEGWILLVFFIALP